MELVIAKYYNKPVVVMIDEQSPYFIDKDVYPWLKHFSDYLVPSLDEAVKFIKKQLDKGEIKCIKTWPVIIGE
jgi:hypothetical protein